MRVRLKPIDYLRKHWLLAGILLCILLASLYPSLGAKEGPFRPEYTVKYGAVSLIFFISGLSLKTDSIFHTFKQVELHLFIQLFTFLFIPLFVKLFVKTFGLLGVEHWILQGFITVGCMPPPVSSAVILTKSARGNETAAIFNSVLGSFLGIIVTPISLLINLGSTTIVPLFGTIVQLLVTVLLPLLLGQCVRKFTSFRVYNLPLNAVGQFSLLFIIYTTFCDTFATREANLSASDILVTVFLVLLLQVLLLMISFYGARYFKKYFLPNDAVCIVFCSTHKSLTLGIPILRIMFHGFAHLNQISLPLLVYHPTQIILGGFLASALKEWVQKHKNQKLPL